MQNNLKKIGIVTGAAGAIGSSISKNFVKQLDRLILIDIDPTKLRIIHDELKNSDCITASYECDIGNSESVKKILDHAINEIGIPNILINNAGVGGPFHRIDEVSD